MNQEIGDQTEVRDLPLNGITAELNECGGDEIEIVAGRQPDKHISDTIVAPRKVWLKSSDEGADEALEIQGINVTALIRFRSAIPPELVDGILND
jgi:hypothetical protein